MKKILWFCGILLIVSMLFPLNLSAQNRYAINQDVTITNRPNAPFSDVTYQIRNGGTELFFDRGTSFRAKGTIYFTTSNIISSVRVTMTNTASGCSTIDQDVIIPSSLCTPTNFPTGNECIGVQDSYFRVFKVPDINTINTSSFTKKYCSQQTVKVLDNSSCIVLYYAVEYYINGDISNRKELFPFSENFEEFSFSPSDPNLGLSPGDNITFLIRYTETMQSTINDHYSDPLVFGFVECSPNLVPERTVVENTTCFGGNNGGITLTFDRNVDTANNYKMRYFVYDASADLDFDPEKENPPQTSEQEILDELIEANDGTGYFSGALPVGLGAGKYKIVYQEFFDAGNGTDATVKSGGVTESFEIMQPTQTTITGTVQLPQSCGGDASISFDANGGFFEGESSVPSDYTYEYRINSTDENDWVEAVANPQPIALTDVAQTVQVRAIYTSRNCASNFFEITGDIPIAPSALTLTKPQPGVASSPIAGDGAISAIFGGGEPSYTFQLSKKVGNTNTFNPIANPDIQINNALQRVEFRGLNVGTYRITVTDTNGCIKTTEGFGDIEVAAAPTPQLETPITTAPFCNNGTDGSVSVALSGTVNPYRYRVLDAGSLEVDSGNGTASPIEVNNLSPGNYSIEVIYNSGDFNVAATVATETFSLVDPNKLTIGLVEIVGLDCNGTTDGYIEISISETGTLLQYSYGNLGTWIDLDPSLRIPITQAGNYNDIKVRKIRGPSDLIGCESDKLDDIFVPAGITVTEDILQHQNVTTNGGNDGAITIDVSGGSNGLTPTYSFEWTGVLLNGGGSYTNNTQNIQDLLAGDYTVKVTDEKNCEKTLGPIQVTEPGPLSLQAPTGTATCNGVATGAVTVEAQGTGNIRFDFFEGSNPTNIIFTTTTSERTITASNLPTGDYGATITEIDSGNRLTTTPADYFTINELPAITATVTPTDATCALPNSGSITITGATGGSNSGFTYGIDDGFPPQVASTFTDLSPRDYIVTITDDQGCEYTETVTIGAGELPIVDTANSGATSPSTIGGNDGFITLNFENTDISSFTYQWNGPRTTNVATQNLTNIEAGNYSVVVTGDPGCSITENFTVTDPAPQDIIPTVTNINCKGDTSGAINVTVVGETPVSHLWTFADDSTITTSNGTTSEDISGLVAGTYVLTITYADNSTFRSEAILITEPTDEITADTNTTPSCSATNTGTIVVSNVQGGEPVAIQDYTYSIDGTIFQNNPLFENLADATYSVWVRDGNGCDGIFSGITVAPSPAIVWDEPNIVVTNATAQGASDGTITLAFTSDATNYTYDWNGPGTNTETTQNLTGKAAGVYTVIITNENGCTLERIFTIAEPGILTITVNSTKNPCFGENNGDIQTTVVGSGNLSYQWSEAVLGDLVGATGPNLNNVPQGTYTLVITDDAISPPNVVSSTPITLSDPAAILNAQAVPTDAQCAGVADGMVAITAGGGIPPYEYSIDGGINYQAQATFNGLGLGTYSIRVRDSNDCVADDGFTINEPTAITLSEVATHLSAAGAADGAIAIAASGGTGDLRFSWEGPAGFTPTTDEDISGLAAGDYTVTVSDENGCTFVSNPITIDEPGAIIIILTLNEEILCNGDEFGEILADVRGGVPDYTYQWFREGNSTPLAETTNILNNLSAGNYFLRITDANGIVRDSNILPITEPDALQVTLQNKVDIVCNGDASGSITINVQGGTLPYVFQWSNGATSQNLDNIEAGDYFIEVFDDNGCSDLLEIKINPAPDALQLDATVTNISEYLANDGSIALDIAGGATPYTINWTRDSDNTPAGNTANLTALSADSYTVSVSDANGCNTTETYEVTQPDIVEDTLVQPSCQGDANGSISVLVNQGNGAFTYLWNTGETTNTISNLGAGDYTVTITGFGDGPLTRNYTLVDPLPLEVDLGQDRVLCVDQVLELDATVEDDTATYTWMSDTGFSSSKPQVTLTTTGNYTVTVQTASGCTAVGTIFLEVSTDEIDAEFAVSSQVFIGEVLVAVDISYPLPDTIEWVFPEGATVVKQDSDEVELIFDQAGEYEITVVTKRGDCIAQKTKKVVVVAKDGSVNEDDDPKKLVEDFIIFPNPTTGQFTADVALSERGNISIKVFNFANNAMMASERGRGESSYSVPFDISGMPSGVYAVLLETPYGTSLRKIVVR